MFSHPEKNVAQMGLMPGMKVADCGAGSGHYALEAARVVAGGGKVYAIDIQEGILSGIKRRAHDARLSNIETVWGDIEKPAGTRLRDNMVDVAILSNVLFQVADKKAVLAEAKRIVKVGGTICIIDWSGTYGKLGPKSEHIVTERVAQSLAEEAGLVFVKNIEAGDHHYGFIVRKMS